MTLNSRTSPLDALDAVKRGSIPAWQALRLASGNRWLARTPLDFRLRIISMLRA